jgi:hypothetical protein
MLAPELVEVEAEEVVHKQVLEVGVVVVAVEAVRKQVLELLEDHILI